MVDQADGECFTLVLYVWQCSYQIPNACGSIGLLHALLNMPDDGALALTADSPLKRFKAESLPLPRKLSQFNRAQLTGSFGAREVAG